MDSPQQRPEESPSHPQTVVAAAPAVPETEAQSPATPGADTKTPAATDAGKPATVAPPANPAADKSYVIGAEDVLGIQVWGDPRLSGSFLVRPDGRISMNLVGEIEAAGKSPGQLETLIAETLKSKEILNRPQVNVSVTQINSKKYYLQGEIRTPGSHPLVVPTRILEALVNAGGFNDFAKQTRIEIIRGTQRFKFNYKEVIKGKHTEQNIFLEPGDIIVVP